MPEVDTVTSLATTEAEEKDGETLRLGDKMTPRELAEFADIDIELVDLLYTAYAVDQEIRAYRGRYRSLWGTSD